MRSERWSHNNTRKVNRYKVASLTTYLHLSQKESKPCWAGVETHLRGQVQSRRLQYFEKRSLGSSIFAIIVEPPFTPYHSLLIKMISERCVS